MASVMEVEADQESVTPTDSHGGDDRRLVITLGPEAAASTRQMAKRLKITPSEAVRRGLTLLHLLMSLGPDEELAIRNRKTKETDRVRVHWGF